MNNLMLIATIFDKDAKKCGALQLCENEKVAKRMFDISMKNVPDEIKDSFELKIIGQFDVETCKIVLLSEEEVPVLPFDEKENS